MTHPTTLLRKSATFAKRKKLLQKTNIQQTWQSSPVAEEPEKSRSRFARVIRRNLLHPSQNTQLQPFRVNQWFSRARARPKHKKAKIISWALSFWLRGETTKKKNGSTWAVLHNSRFDGPGSDRIFLHTFSLKHSSGLSGICQLSMQWVSGKKEKFFFFRGSRFGKCALSVVWGGGNFGGLLRYYLEVQIKKIRSS